MTSDPICADVGTRNCPCPLAETGDCAGMQQIVRRTGMQLQVGRRLRL